LFVGGNRIESVAIDCAAVTDLLYLDVSRNLLKALPDVSSFASLRVFFAGYNPISTRLTAGFPASLRELHLAGCRLPSLPTSATPLGALQFAFLANNKLAHRSEIDAMLSASSKTLRFVDISRNRLQKAPSSVSGLQPGVDVQTELVNAKGISGIEYGISVMTGKRPAMEDVAKVHANLLGNLKADLVVVMDGHGGDTVAKAAAATICDHLCSHLSSHLESDEATVRCISDAFKAASAGAMALSVDKLIGTTALVGVFATTAATLTLHVANIGDTRAVMRCKDGSVLRLSTEHKPLDPTEYTRIVSAGGWVTPEGRVKDTLAIARALGDSSLQDVVSSEPSISSVRVQSEVEFVIFASDGVWDVVRDEVASAVVHSALERKHATASTAAMALRDWAYLSGSQDNISIVIATLPGCQ
jgi:protein phosphatase 1L